MILSTFAIYQAQENSQKLLYVAEPGSYANKHEVSYLARYAYAKKGVVMVKCM